jgi:hypothetical protein
MIISFLIILSALMVFLPVITCNTGEKVSGKVCQIMGLCTTDIYTSVGVYLISDCSVSHGYLSIVLLLIAFLMAAIVLSYLIEYLYKRYRDL